MKKLVGLLVAIFSPILSIAQEAAVSASSGLMLV
jgi:hypothetical protein